MLGYSERLPTSALHSHGIRSAGIFGEKLDDLRFAHVPCGKRTESSTNRPSFRPISQIIANKARKVQQKVGVVRRAQVALCRRAHLI